MNTCRKIATALITQFKASARCWPDAYDQRRLIKKIASTLQSGSRLLFTAPNESGSFPPDVMTGRPQFSLGYEEYRKALEAEGMSLIGTHRDEGENHYYFAQKR